MSEQEQRASALESRDDLVDSATNKNKKKIKCMRCDSYILSAQSCVLRTLEASVDVPCMMSKRELKATTAPAVLDSAAAAATTNVDESATKFASEAMNEFWLAGDMLTFENVGFTNLVGNKKFLICADCEIGTYQIRTYIPLCLD